MEALSQRMNPKVVYEGDKAVSILLDIKVYEELLEQLEDIEDLQALEELRKKRPPHYTPIEDYLKELGINDV